MLAPGAMSLERLRESLSDPTAARSKVRLAAQDRDLLAQCALSMEDPWWRRRSCLEGLRGRVPPHFRDALLALAFQHELEAEVRAAALTLIAVGDPVEPRFAAELVRLSECEGSVGDEAISARARLGDLTVARDLVELAASPWRGRRDRGLEHARILVELAGLPAVAQALGAAPPSGGDDASDRAWADALCASGSIAVRRFGVWLLGETGHSPLPALADPDFAVAGDACDVLVQQGAADALLVYLDMALADPPSFGATLDGPSRQAVWILLALHRLGHDVTGRWAELAAPAHPLALPEDVRDAILREYALQAERGTDPRWLLEQAARDLEPVKEEQESLWVERLADVARAAGYHVGEPVPVGTAMQQGGGTYFLVDVGGITINVSTLGPFLTAPPPTSSQEQALPDDLREAARVAGFRWIEGELAATKVDGLNVYFFGSRDPLTVLDLLFYWQD